MSELKSCPFCGDMPYQDPKYLYVKCETVGCASYCYQSPVPPKLWNTRHDSDLIATQDALKELSLAFTIQSVTRDDCERFGIVFKEHECGCEVCSMASKLCPATQSTIIQAIQHKALSNPILKKVLNANT